MQEFVANNNVIVDDTFYDFNEDEYEKNVLNARPWKNDPNYFTKCKINAIALIKMLQHAKKGGNIEVMGYIRGKVVGKTFVIMDAFPLPVEATETRVNANQDALEYIGKYNDLCDVIKRQENVVGWYHSHPSYGPWLSGIDVATQRSCQMTDPQLAIVIDPIRTQITGKVDIGAFRTYKPEDVNAMKAQRKDVFFCVLIKILEQ